MIEAIIWGLVQGLTEFLPVSSSGHLRLIPELFGLDPPDLSTSAVLHLGTLAAVVAYYRTDIAWMVRKVRHDAVAQRMVLLLVIATVPAGVLGLVLTPAIARFQESATAVGAAFLATGAVLAASHFFPPRARRAEEMGNADALGIGLAQAVALLPGISRSGMVIAAGIMRGLSRTQAARFGFLMAVPVTIAGGTREALTLAGSGTLGFELVVGTAVAAVVGYLAISLLVKGLATRGMWPFAIYCALAGAVALILL